MQDNYTYNDIVEQLIGYMDGELGTAEKEKIEKLIQQDEGIKERYDNLLSARSAIKLHGLKQRIQSLHEQFYTEIKTEQKNTAEKAKVVMPSFMYRMKPVLRIAAVLIFMAICYGVFEYSTTSNESVFADNYISYQLPVSRGEKFAFTKIDSLFQISDFKGVIGVFESTNDKTQKEYFLAGLAYLETGNSKASINSFKTLEGVNSTASEKYFEQELDFYLMLANIKAGNIEEAEKELNTITANRLHKYYQKAIEFSKIKFSILKWKE